MPTHSQRPSPSETASRLNPRMLNEYRGPASPGDVIANPRTPTRPPREGNTTSPTISPRPSPTVASPISFRVKLKPDKEPVPTDQPVKLKAILTPPFREAIYTFYADGTAFDGGRNRNETVAQFSTPGPHVVSVHVWVRGIEEMDSITIQVHFVPQSSPTPTAAASAPITPSPPSYSPSPTATATVGFITVTPSGGGINVASPTATRSLPAHHSATPSVMPSNGGSESQKGWWILYIVSAGLAAVALYGIAKLIKPTFHPHADWDAPQRPPQNLAINYGLYFHSNVSAGQDRLQTDGPRLILRKRTQ